MKEEIKIYTIKFINPINSSPFLRRKKMKKEEENITL